MSAKQTSAGQSPDIVVSKTESSRKARQDRVNLLEIRDYVCIEPETPLAKAIEAMKKEEGGCAIVCDKDTRVVGIFTERDLLTKIVGNDVDLAAPVSNWMSTSVATLDPEATIGDAVDIMNEKSYRNIPIARDGKLIGSISVFDVITYLAECYPKAAMNLPPNPEQVMESPEGG